MSAKQGGSLAMLLLAIPLSAIPLMAIFGIPEFVSLSAVASEAAPSDLLRQPITSFGEPGGPQLSAEEQHRRAAADLLAPADAFPRESGRGRGGWSDVDTGGPGQHEPQQNDPQRAGARTQPATAQPSPRPMQTAAPQPLIRTLAAEAASPAPVPTDGGLSWREATRRIEEIGITDYALERGETSDRFLFMCRFSPGGDERIVQRFEAEGSEPLEAVENVLGQVEAWLQHRFADSRRWLR